MLRVWDMWQVTKRLIKREEIFTYKITSGRFCSGDGTSSGDGTRSDRLNQAIVRAGYSITIKTLQILFRENSLY